MNHTDAALMCRLSTESEPIICDGGCGLKACPKASAAFVADEVVMRCATCGKEKPNDAAWARPATCCGESRWTGSVTFSQTPEGVVAHGEIRYGIEVPDAWEVESDA